MKKILGVILLILFISGCSKSNQLDEISNAIIKFHKDYNYDISSLNNKSVDALNDFKDREKVENKEINLSRSNMMNDYFKTDQENSAGVYEKDGEYYIKYNDVPFEFINGKNVAIVVAGGYELELYKDNYPILYTETNNDNYEYRFINKVEKDDNVKYYYRSYGNGSILTINYELKDNNIKDIYLEYNENFDLEEINDVSVNVFTIIFIIFVFIILVSLCALIGYKLIKNKEV